MAKIYVSSTYLDLKDYREQVERVIRRMGHTDVAMEYYVAEDTRPTAKCVSDVAACDVYVGIFAWRYGWQPTDDNPDNLSITEMEFRQAEKTGKPCFIFLLSDDAPWPRKHMDKDVSKIEILRNTASAKHTADYFTTPDELARKVAEAIYKQIPVAVSIPEYNLTTYYEALRKRYNVLALEGLTPPQKEEYLQIQLSSVFVEQSVREDTPPVELPKEVWEKLSREQEIHDEDLPSGITLDDVRKARDSYYQKPSRLVLDALTDSRSQYTIILGDPGSGKSTLARYVMLSLIDPLLADDKIQKAFEGYLPLLIELRTFAGLCAEGKCQTPLEFLEYLGKTEGWGLTESALNNHLKNDGRAVVIFDGLDEIFEPKMREMITNQIVGFTNMYPKARVIVTSRILGYRRKILSDAGFTHFTLQDLDEKQVGAFITQWYQLAMNDRLDEAKERSERILKSFADSASIRQLAGNPMLLTIMAIIGKHQELPRERWKLYDHAASVLIQHWDVNKHLKDENLEADFIGEDDKKELLRRLAYRMQNGDGKFGGNYIDREGLQEEFESYLKERYSQTPDRAKIIAEAMIQQFRERNFILSLYGANVFGFVHRAFLEYFCASAFVWKFEKTKELTIEQLKADVYGKHWEDQSWHEVLRLICGMVDEKWVGEIINFLAIKVNFPWPKTFNNNPPWNLVVSAYCLSEVRNLSIISDTAGRLLSQLCKLFDHLAIEEWTLDEFTSKHLLPATRLIGSMWPQRAILADWLLANRSSQKWNFLVRTPGIFVSFVGIGLDKIYQSIQDLSQINHNDNNFPFEFLVGQSIESGLYSEVEHLPLLQHLFFNTPSTYIQSAALSGLAQYFNKDIQILPLLQEHAIRNENIEVRSAAVSALAEHYREDAATLPLLQERAVQDSDANVRRVAVSVLAEHYRADAATLLFLRERAVQDTDANVRRAAVSALAEHYRADAATLPFLRELAVQDTDANVRSTAVRALAEGYREDARTLPLLRERAVQDVDSDVRSAAVSALAEHYREDPQTLPLLRERAVQDASADVRSDAVVALAKHYREDAQTLPLLRERAVQDESPKPDDEKGDFWQKYVRDAAIEAIAKHWRDHPGTLPLLRERAENDPTPWLRERCKELIEGKKE